MAVVGKVLVLKKRIHVNARQLFRVKENGGQCVQVPQNTLVNVAMQLC